jgi:hypothetical protein
MEEIKQQTGTIPTPNEILAKYLEPTDNSYMIERQKGLEADNIELQKIVGDPKKEAKWKKAKSYKYNTPQGQIDYNKRQIDYYKTQVNQGIFRGNGRSNVNKTLGLYENKQCVVAGLIENLMGLFIIRGKTKAFAFVVQKGDFWIGGYSYKIGHVTIENFYKIFEEVLAKQKDADGPAKIYNQELYERIKREKVVRAIQNK